MKAACKECKQLFRIWVVAGRPRDPAHPARSAYKEAKKHFRSCLRLHRRVLADKFFASLDVHSTDSKRLFQSVRKYILPNRLSSTQHLEFDGKVFDSETILDGWASYFESLSSPGSISYSDEQLQILAEYSRLCSLPPDAPDLIVADEVEAVIRSLPLKKAAGPDHITNEHLKFGGSMLPAVLTSLFNAILLSGYIPAVFRHGLIVPIPKGHNQVRSDPFNYRGITLLSVISKVFEKVILFRLSEQQAQLNPLQGGFRTGVSCLHSAFVFQEAISLLQEQHKKAYVAFLDVKKAFDTVWHCGLMVKLHQKKVPLYLWHNLNKWYCNFTSSVPTLLVLSMECIKDQFFLLCYILSLWTIFWIA